MVIKQKKTIPRHNRTFGVSSSLFVYLISMRHEMSLLTDQRPLAFVANQRNIKRYVASCMVQTVLVFSIEINNVRQPTRRVRPKKGARLHGNWEGTQKKILN